MVAKYPRNPIGIKNQTMIVAMTYAMVLASFALLYSTYERFRYGSRSVEIEDWLSPLAETKAKFVKVIVTFLCLTNLLQATLIDMVFPFVIPERL